MHLYVERNTSHTNWHFNHDNVCHAKWMRNKTLLINFIRITVPIDTPLNYDENDVSKSNPDIIFGKKNIS